MGKVGFDGLKLCKMSALRFIYSLMFLLTSSRYPESYKLNTNPAVLIPSALVLSGRNTFSVENCKLGRYFGFLNKM